MSEEPKSEPQPPQAPEPRRSRSERRVQAAADVLRTLIRDLYMERFGTMPPDGADLDLDLRLKVQPGSNWSLVFDPPVAEQLFDQVTEAQADWEVYRRGRVYCYRCGTSECEHAVPGTPLEVFAGYDSMGRPEWRDLAQAFIAARDPRVDRLFGRADARPGGRTLALVELGSELKGRQLAVFGKSSKTYAVLGQVVAGYFQKDGERIAVTFQAVEARGGDGRIRVHLNAIARMPGTMTLNDALAAGWEPAAHRALAMAARATEALERQAQLARAGGRTDEVRGQLQRVPTILRRLAESLERGERQFSRRTQHAEERRQAKRPIHKALEDARAAAPESVYYDEKARTLIALGDQHRAHVFSGEGRHVTSFFIQPDAVAFRVRTTRWRAATPAEVVEFKAKLSEAITPRIDIPA
jgi:hypothetical protein